MDQFTNYILSGVLTLLIWAIGAIYIRLTSPEDTMAYLQWLKIWAILAGFLAVAFSLLLGVMFPDPALEQFVSILG